jgi:hypothetical protein
MRNLIRSPLTWMVAAELAVVGALVVLAWNVVASAVHASSAAPAAVSAPGDSADTASPLPQLPDLNVKPVRGPLPGLNLDPNFWRGRLGGLNADQASLERLEWAIVRNAEQAAQDYLESVVLPAIRHAEHAGGAALG